jgi:hypothetical protein
MTLAPRRCLHEAEVLPMLRELYSCLPEALGGEPYELQSLLWSLRYCEDLIPEDEIAAALEALRVEGEVLP